MVCDKLHNVLQVLWDRASGKLSRYINAWGLKYIGINFAVFVRL